MNDETHRTPLSAESRTSNGAAVSQAPTRPEGATRPLPDDALIILPVRNVVMFPGAVFPITVGRERSRTAVQEAHGLAHPPRSELGQEHRHAHGERRRDD